MGKQRRFVVELDANEVAACAASFKCSEEQFVAMALGDVMGGELCEDEAEVQLRITVNERGFLVGVGA